MKEILERNGLELKKVIIIIIIIISLSVAINIAFGDNGFIKKAELEQNLTINSVTSEEDMLENDSGVTKEWDTSKVTPVESEDGVTVPIPEGYIASEATGEKSVSTGFVIYEGTETVDDDNVEIAKTERNQFVWVPVDDIDDIAWEANGDRTDSNGRTNYQGKLYDFSSDGATEMSSYGQGITSYREPAIVTGNSSETGSSYDGSYGNYSTILGLNSSSEFLTQLQEEFNEMIESIETYGGFYIGRYETGKLQENDDAEPVVVQGESEISNVNWYYMYQNSKLVAEEGGSVVTTMLWGCLWDRTLIWLTETNAANKANGKSYAEIVNSSDWGNYSSSSVQATGSSEAWKANNIYDLAGNVLEWTIEACTTFSRVYRGGGYLVSGSVLPVSDRSIYDPSDSSIYLRVTSSTLYRTMSSDKDSKDILIITR